MLKEQVILAGKQQTWRQEYPPPIGSPQSGAEPAMPQQYQADISVFREEKIRIME